MSQRQPATADVPRGDDRSPFDKFVEASYQRVSRAPFFALCAGIVILWFASVPLWPDLKSWQVAIHTVGSVVSLLLIVLLENASRRSEEAAQAKLDVIAEALSHLMLSRAQDDVTLIDAAEKLRAAIGLEDRH